MSASQRLTEGMSRFRGPRAELEGTGLLVPGVVLRLAVLAAGAGLTALLVAGRPTAWLVFVLAALVVACACAPGSVVVGVLGLLAVAVQLGYGRLDPRAVATALALHVLWLACALAAAVPVSGRLELAALLPALRRLAAVAALTVLVAAVTSAVRAVGVRAGEQLLLLVGVLVLAGGATVAVLVRSGRRDRA